MAEIRPDDLEKDGQIVRWTAYPSWRHFIWLYCFSAVAGLRGLLALRREGSGGAVWMGGAAVLLVCAAGLRLWAKYVLTSQQVAVTNGYTGRRIRAMAVNEIDEIAVSQGPLAQIFDIGTVEIRSVDGDRILLSGIRSPEVIKTRIEALKR